MADRLISPQNRKNNIQLSASQVQAQKVTYGNQSLSTSAQSSIQAQQSRFTQSPFKEYKWFNSDSVQQELHCGLCRLELPVSISIDSSIAPQDLWVTAQVICYGTPVQEGLLSTSFALSDAKVNAFVWNTLFNFQVKIKDLSLDATIIFTAWVPSDEREGKIYGVTTMGLFEKNGELKSGHQKLLFYPTKETEEKSSLFASDVSKFKNTSISVDLKQNYNARYMREHAEGEKYSSYSNHDQAFIMEKNLQEYDRKTDLNNDSYDYNDQTNGCESELKNNWLNSLTRTRIESMFDELSSRDMLGAGLAGGRGNGSGTRIENSNGIGTGYGNGGHLLPMKTKISNHLLYSPEERALRSLFCLIIELPFPPHPILFKEKLYASVKNHYPPSTLAQMMPFGCCVVVEKEEKLKNNINSSTEFSNENNNSSSPATILEFSLTGGLMNNHNTNNNGNNNGNNNNNSNNNNSGLSLTNNININNINSLIGSAAFTGSSLCVIADWDIDQENLAEQQYRCLAHEILRGKLDPSVKPSLEDKGKINKILNAAGTHMEFDEMDLIYRYRYFLTENKKALVKFLLSVDCTVESEIAEIPILLALWKKKASIDISDALRLLGKEKIFQSLIVRQYAIDELRSANDEELLTFLLQLVQALRYEPVIGVIDDNNDNILSSLRLQDDSTYNIASSFSSSFVWTRLGMSSSGIPNPSSSNLSNLIEKRTTSTSTVIGHHGAGVVSPLAQFLIDRACISPIVANFFHWYLRVEGEDVEPYGLLFRQILDSFLIQLASSPSCKFDNNNDNNKNNNNNNNKDNKNNDDNNNKDMKNNKIPDVFQGAECALQLHALNEYISKIFECHSMARAISGRKDVKQAALRKLLSERGLENIPCGIEGVPMPLNPRLQIISLDPLSATMFASAVYPCVIEFICVENVPYTGPISVQSGGSELGSDSTVEGHMNINSSTGTHLINNSTLNPSIRNEGKDDREDLEILESEGEGTWVVDEFDDVIKIKDKPEINLTKRKIVRVKLMFKSGDDLRQDQLVMQMMKLMDSLLRKVNLNLKLLTYGILAAGQTNGIMEFVSEASAISAILKEHKSLSKFLRIHNPDTYGPYGTTTEAIDTFVKSCAASCVVSYLLGVGDRHLDNIMMKTNGQIFHIDYGYSFFQDPKPVQPPPFRFTHHMLDAMGGEESEYYEKFKSYCCQAFNWLRKSANLILNLLSLMGDAGITDISKRSDLPKVLAKVEERFRLDLSDESAESYFVGLITESLNAIAPRLLEYAHQIAVSAEG